jgi:transcriptional regulator with XRE-family HTH domain
MKAAWPTEIRRIVMSVGERIKFHRKRRDMTQRGLGTEVGFPPASADVRIAQYESGSRSPKEPMLNALAAALEISPASLTVPDLDDPATLLHILFALEDRYDLKLSQSNCATNVQISIPSQSVTHLYCMLFLWQIMRDRLASGKLTREEYDEWRYGVT